MPAFSDGIPMKRVRKMDLVGMTPLVPQVQERDLYQQKFINDESLVCTFVTFVFHSSCFHIPHGAALRNSDASSSYASWWLLVEKKWNQSIYLDLMASDLQPCLTGQHGAHPRTSRRASCQECISSCFHDPHVLHCIWTYANGATQLNKVFCVRFPGNNELQSFSLGWFSFIQVCIEICAWQCWWPSLARAVR